MLTLLAGVVLKTNQFSVTEYYIPNNSDRHIIPALDFIYDISPIIVSIKEKKLCLTHFVVRLCAVVGGVFATTGIHQLSGPNLLLDCLITAQQKLVSPAFTGVTVHDLALKILQGVNW